VDQEIVAFSCVQIMGLLIDNKDEIGRELVWLLVALVGECDLRSLLPARLYIDC